MACALIFITIFCRGDTRDDLQVLGDPGRVGNISPVRTNIGIISFNITSVIAHSEKPYCSVDCIDLRLLNKCRMQF